MLTLFASVLDSYVWGAVCLKTRTLADV